MENLIKIEKNEDGNLYVSSRVIASQLEKRHDIVLRDCREKLETHDFVESSYNNSQNKQQPEYLLTKNSFILLVMNYEGFNDFKRDYIKRFDEMEKQLVSTQKSLPKTYGEALLEAGRLQLQVEEQKIEIASKDSIIETNKPLVEFTKTVLKSKDLILVRELAKIISDDVIKTGERKLYKWLRDKKLIMSSSTEPYQSAIDKGYFKVIERTLNTSYGIKLVRTTKVTPKGQVYIVESFRKEFAEREIKIRK